MHRVHLRMQLRDIERRVPILVYQMGKVGSSTVVRTLKQLGLDTPILHIHTLNARTLERAIQKERSSSKAYLPEHLIASSLLVNRLKRDLFPCKVITLTREPIGRAISFAFEDWKKKARDAWKTDGTLDATAMQAAVDRMLEGQNGHADPARWFDQELKAVFGIDVFAVPYDFKRGYVLLAHKEVSVLVLRMEDLDRALPDALEAFLETSPSSIVVRRANLGKESWYAETLQAVKERYHLSEAIAERVLNTRYMKHFYAREREALRARWSA